MLNNSSLDHISVMLNIFLCHSFKVHYFLKIDVDFHSKRGMAIECLDMSQHSFCIHFSTSKISFSIIVNKFSKGNLKSNSNSSNMFNF